MDINLTIGLFWIGFIMLCAGLILRYLFPKYDQFRKSDDAEKLFDNDQDPNGC